MAWTRAGIALGVGALAIAALSGGTSNDPQTPAGLSGLPAPFLGVAVVGSGGRAEAVDAYGDVVDLRAPGAAGRALVAVSSQRQAAGTVAPGEAIVARARLGDGTSAPFWRADSIRQRYLPGTNVLRTVARFGSDTAVVVRRLGGPDAAGADRRWLARARPLGTGAPRWARAMYRRSLLVLRALTDRGTGAVAAGARDGWAYIWPRDAATVAIAFAAAGYRQEAQRVARFLVGLDLTAAARFRGTGAPVPGRGAQGDAAGWVAAAAGAAGIERGPAEGRAAGGRSPSAWTQWRDRPDYQESGSGDFLANAIASAGVRSAAAFETRRGLVRTAGDPSSGLDSAAAWAVRPFPRPALFPTVRRTLLRLVARREPLRDRSIGTLGWGRRPLDGADRVDRIGARHPCAQGGRSRSTRQRRPGRPPRRPAPHGRSAPGRHAARLAAGAGQRPHRPTRLDHAPRLVARLRGPCPAGYMASATATKPVKRGLFLSVGISDRSRRSSSSSAPRPLPYATVR